MYRLDESLGTGIRTPVLSKADFARRYAAGEFGNHSPTWPDLSTFYWQPGKRYGLRSTAGGGGFNRYDLCGPKVLHLWRPGLYISEMAPRLYTLNAEVMIDCWGIHLTYSTVNAPMRTAMDISQKTAVGLRAQALLGTKLNDASQHWLSRLLCDYPGHVIELSTFGRCWGSEPGYNTVFWEVRKY